MKQERKAREIWRRGEGREKMAPLHLELLNEFPCSLDTLVDLCRVESDTLGGGSLSSGLAADNLAHCAGPVLCGGFLGEFL